MQNKKLQADHQFPGIEGVSLCDFWSWAYSDLNTNTIRPLIAEFLVGYSLGVLESPRIEWDAYDFNYNGSKIEVKSSAYIQSWAQKRHSLIKFDIAGKKAWDARTNTNSNDRIRSADLYVFCFLDEIDENRVNPVDVSQWKFFVMTTNEIESVWGNQKSVCLNILQKKCKPVDFENLKSEIDRKLGIDK